MGNPHMYSHDDTMRIGGGSTTSTTTEITDLKMYSANTMHISTATSLTVTTPTVDIDATTVTIDAGNDNSEVAHKIDLTTGKLNIDGDIHVTGGLTIYQGGLYVEGGLTVLNDGITSPVITTSDERLKTDIIPLPSPLTKVSKLRGVYFSWVKDEPNGLKFDDRRHVGVLAQDVQGVLPETVDEIAGGKYLGVDYPALIPLLIEAIKELNTRTSTMTQLEELMEIIRKHEEMINNINERLT